MDRAGPILSGVVIFIVALGVAVLLFKAGRLIAALSEQQDLEK